MELAGRTKEKQRTDKELLNSSSKVIRSYAAEQRKAQRVVQKSREHILALLNPDVLRPSLWKSVVLQKPLTLYKVVAASDGALLSVFDGTTEYRLGKWTLAKHGAASWPPLQACFYAYISPSEAILAAFPPDSVLLGAPKMLIQVEAVGEAYFNQEARMWAVSRVKPLQLITQAGPPANGSAAAAAALPLDVHYAVNPIPAPAETLERPQRKPAPAAQQEVWVP